MDATEMGSPVQKCRSIKVENIDGENEPAVRCTEKLREPMPTLSMRIQHVILQCTLSPFSPQLMHSHALTLFHF